MEENTEKIKLWKSQEIDRSRMTFDELWNYLEVGDFISTFNEVEKGEGRGQMILFKNKDAVVLSYCENCASKWKQQCSTITKEKLKRELLDDDAGIEKFDRGKYKFYKVNNIKPMNKITTLAKRLLDKKLQKLYKAGYINDGISLTEKGKEVLLEILFLEKKDELAKLAQEEIDEE